MRNIQVLSVLAKSAFVGALALTSSNAHALKIDAKFSSDMTTAQKSAFSYAAAQFENTFTNNATIVMDVCSSVSTDVNCGLTNASGVGLGASLSYYYSYNLNSSNYNLITDTIKSADAGLALPSFTQLTNALATANLTNTITRLALTTADVAVLSHLSLGSTYSNPDGVIYFNASNSYTTSVNTPVPSNGYNLISVFEHEISEVLGRVSYLPNNYLSPTDLLRYSAEGTLSLNKNTNTPVYLSTDLGATKLVNVNTNYLSGDLVDFTGTTDAFNYVAYKGVAYSTTLTPIDIAAMKALGYTVATAVPEPETYQMLMLGLLGIGYQVRKTKSIA